MQKSWPWGYLQGNDSLVGYLAKEDSSIRAAIARSGGMIVDSGIRTLAALANIGVFYSVDNKLAVTNPGGAANRIDVNTGAAFTCGIFHYNDTSIGAAGDITSPAANPRIDRVVVRANFAVAAYVPANASAALFTVPTNTARVTIIHGAENPAPVAPALTQDAARLTYWDIPLYQYQISVAGAITNLTDEREWVDAETKQLFVPAMIGYNATLANMLSDNISLAQNQHIFVFPDTNDCYAVGKFVCPSDYLASMTSQGVFIVVGGAGLNIYALNYACFGTCGAAYNTTTVAGALAAEAFGLANEFSCHRSLALAGVAAGDLVTTRFFRNGANVLDTLGADAYFTGWLIEYLGWR